MLCLVLLYNKYYTLHVNFRTVNQLKYIASLNIISRSTHRIPQWADPGASCDSSPARTAPVAQNVGTG